MKGRAVVDTASDGTLESQPEAVTGAMVTFGNRSIRLGLKKRKSFHCF